MKIEGYQSTIGDRITYYSDGKENECQLTPLPSGIIDSNDNNCTYPYLVIDNGGDLEKCNDTSSIIKLWVNGYTIYDISKFVLTSLEVLNLKKKGVFPSAVVSTDCELPNLRELIVGIDCQFVFPSSDNIRECLPSLSSLTMDIENNDMLNTVILMNLRELSTSLEFQITDELDFPELISLTITNSIYINFKYIAAPKLEKLLLKQKPGYHVDMKGITFDNLIEFSSDGCVVLTGTSMPELKIMHTSLYNIIDKCSENVINLDSVEELTTDFNVLSSHISLPNLKSLNLNCEKSSTLYNCIDLSKLEKLKLFGKKSRSQDNVHGIVAPNLKELDSGIYFRQGLIVSSERSSLPSINKEDNNITCLFNLEVLKISDSYNRPLDHLYVPNLKGLILGSEFNQKLVDNCVNVLNLDKLEYLSLGSDYNQSLNGLKVPNLKCLDVSRCNHTVSLTNFTGNTFDMSNLEVLLLSELRLYKLKGLIVPKLKVLHTGRDSVSSIIGKDNKPLLNLDCLEELYLSDVSVTLSQESINGGDAMILDKNIMRDMRGKFSKVHRTLESLGHLKVISMPRFVKIPMVTPETLIIRNNSYSEIKIQKSFGRRMKSARK